MRPYCSVPECTEFAFRFGGAMLCEDHAAERGLSALGMSCRDGVLLKRRPDVGVLAGAFEGQPRPGMVLEEPPGPIGQPPKPVLASKDGVTKRFASVKLAARSLHVNSCRVSAHLHSGKPVNGWLVKFEKAEK